MREYKDSWGGEMKKNAAHVFPLEKLKKQKNCDIQNGMKSMFEKQKKKWSEIR